MRRKAKWHVTRRCLLGDTAVMRRNNSFISRHLQEITTMAAPGCGWSRCDIRRRKKERKKEGKKLWKHVDQNSVWPTFRGANCFIREESGKKKKKKSVCMVELQFPPSCYWVITNLLLVMRELFFSSPWFWCFLIFRKQKYPEFFINKWFAKVGK